VAVVVVIGLILPWEKGGSARLFVARIGLVAQALEALRFDGIAAPSRV
jgi:hypothetical protein